MNGRLYPKDAVTERGGLNCHKKGGVVSVYNVAKHSSSALLPEPLMRYQT